MGDTAPAKAECMTSDGLDAALAQGLRDHPADACAELYNRFATKLCFFILAQLPGEAETAQDLLVETFAEAVRNIRRFDARRSTLSAWLHGIVRRRVHLELRRRNRRKSIPLGQQVSIDAVRESSDPEDIAATTAARLDAQKEIAELAHVLSSLEMATLVLSYVEEFSVREIGRIIGRSERAVDSILHRAKRKARERPGDYDD